MDGARAVMMMPDTVTDEGREAMKIYEHHEMRIAVNWVGFKDMAWGFNRFDLRHTDWALLWDWWLMLGPIEIRRWAR
jgi:hypothetical protein